MRILKVFPKMNIIAASPGKSIDPFVSSPPQLKFFLNFKKDVGINWLVTSSWVIKDATTNGASKSFEKVIIGSRKGSTMKAPDYSVVIKFLCSASKDSVEESTASIVLRSYSTNAPIANYFIGRPSFSSQSEMMSAINSIFGLLGLSGKNAEMPSEYYKKINAEKNAESIKLKPVTINGKEAFYYHRLSRIRTNTYPASVMEFYILKSGAGYIPVWSYSHIELDKGAGAKALSEVKTLGDSMIVIADAIKTAREQKGYVGPESLLYIPEGATKENWDFTLHKMKPMTPDQETENEVNNGETQQIPPIDMEKESPQEETVSVPYRKPILNLKKLFGSSQDFEGYFSGEVPDIAGAYVGTSAVDASQISGLFSGTNEAISLVNSYTSDALKNVAYIFNFSKGGAYGVYIPALDKAIKTKALKRQLEQKGYKIVEEHGVLTAHPTKEETTPEQIDKDIDDLWNQLNSQGGSALGINMSDVLKATQENTSKIMNDLRSQAPEVPPQIESILKEVLGVYHLAAIILHEASHAKGGDEGKAQSDEQAFRSWGQSHLNRQYQSKLSSAGLDEFYTPLELGTEVLHAASKNWYKEAQGMMGRLNYSPSAGAPSGSDIRGRYNGQNKSEGFAEWAMLVQQDQSIPIEQRLNRGNMAPLEKDVDQENDSIEEQLRKQFRNDSKPNTQLILEELLAPDRNESQGYKTMETMLEELRPQPLMVPLQKAAMSKTANSRGTDGCLFGWYNNLDLADGSTIPGLSDRVMAWDDRDESFSNEEKWIKSQERYNPEYDLKGFYYRWIEPRFKPELFDDMTRDYVNTHPAKRFAAKLDPTLSRMLSVIKLIEEEIVNEEIKATRLVVTEELLDLVKRLLAKEGLRIRAYKVSNLEGAFSIWVYGTNVSENDLDKAERYFQNVDGSEQYKDLVENLLNGKSLVTAAVEKVVDTAKELCKKYEVDDLYIVGEYARKIFEGEASPFVSELNFTCESIDAGLKIGNVLANTLNVPNDFVILGHSGIIFPYKGIRIVFSKSQYVSEIGSKMQERGYNIEDPVLRDICNKDFTINMMAYNVRQMKVIDPMGVKTDIKNKIAKTLFDPSFVIESNPMIIFRAISLKLDGYTIDEDLERSMIEGSEFINSGRFSPQRLRFTREFLRSKGTSEIDSLLEEYGLVFDNGKKEEI